MSDNRATFLNEGQHGVYDSIIKKLQSNEINPISSSKELTKDDIYSWRAYLPGYDININEYEELDMDQKKFVEECLYQDEHNNDGHINKIIFATGPGGCGKSKALKVMKERLHWQHMTKHIFYHRDGTIQKAVLDYIEYMGKETILTTAPTGIAASGIGGATYHSALDIGTGFKADGKKSFGSFINNRMLQRTRIDKTFVSRPKPILTKLQNDIKTIIIDEISMVSAYTLDMIDRYLQHIKIAKPFKTKNNHIKLSFRGNDNHYYDNPGPFGGIQIIIIGDLCQLKPVHRDDEEASDASNRRHNDPFFMADVFKYRSSMTNGIPNINHNGQAVILIPILFHGRYRFDDKVWGKALDSIRFGTIPDWIIDKLTNANRFPKLKRLPDDITHITYSNKQRDAINTRKLREHEHINVPTFVYKVKRMDCPSNASGKIIETFSDDNINSIMSKNRIDDRFKLTIGARVMVSNNMKVVKIEWLSTNDDTTKPISDIAISDGYRNVVNGDIGTVCGLEQKHTWAYDDGTNIITDKDVPYDKSKLHPRVYIKLQKSGDVVAISGVKYEESIDVYADIHQDSIRYMNNEIDIDDEDISAFQWNAETEPLNEALVVNITLQSKTGKQFFGVAKSRIIGIVDTIDYDNGEVILKHRGTRCPKKISMNNPKYVFHYRKIQFKKHALFVYTPLQLAWAITIHKSQGLTLDKIYAFKKTNALHQTDNNHGLLYVVLSRVRTLDGLKFSFCGRNRNYQLESLPAQVARKIILKKWCNCDARIKKFYELLDKHYDPNEPIDGFNIPDWLLIDEESYNKSHGIKNSYRDIEIEESDDEIDMFRKRECPINKNEYDEEDYD